MISFTVPGKPAPQPRARGRIVGKGAKAFVSMYTPPEGKEYRAAVKLAATEAVTGFWKHYDGPIKVSILISLERAKSHRKANGDLTDKAPEFPLNMRSGDVDNYAKAVMDQITGTFWRDDAQVTVLVVGKRYSDGDPSTEVTIETV